MKQPPMTPAEWIEKTVAAAPPLTQEQIRSVQVLIGRPAWTGQRGVASGSPRRGLRRHARAARSKAQVA